MTKYSLPKSAYAYGKSGLTYGKNKYQHKVRYVYNLYVIKKSRQNNFLFTCIALWKYFIAVWCSFCREKQLPTTHQVDEEFLSKAVMSWARADKATSFCWCHKDVL